MALPVLGSGLFSAMPALAPHLGGPTSVRLGAPGGLKSEIAVLREELRTLFLPLTFLVTQEYTNPVVADVDAHLLAKAPSDTVALTYTTSGSGVTGALDGAVASATMPFGRNVTVTTVGADAEFAFPFNVTVSGTRDGVAISEVITVVIGASPGTTVGAKIFDKVTQVVIASGAGAAASAGTVSVGFGALLGLPARYPLATRAGLVSVMREVAVGVVVTTGTFVAAQNSYAPSAAPDGAKDYCVTYEADASGLKLKLGQRSA